MTDLPIHLATLRYDHMRPLIDGTVRIDGVEASFHTPAGLVPWLFEPGGDDHLALQDRVDPTTTHRGSPALDYNHDRGDEQFKPYGATVGHAFERARLITQTSAAADDTGLPQSSGGELFRQAVTDSWARSGRPGFVYTTDWAGTSVVGDQLHGVASEAIGAAVSLWHATGATTLPHLVHRVVEPHSCHVHR